MTTKQMTLWELIDHIGSDLPFRREKTEILFGIKLLQSEASNEYWTFWDSAHSVPINGVNISRILLAVKNNDDANIGALSLNIDDSCVKLEQVKQRYDLQLIGYPRGRSFDEETTYESITSWGSLVFGFAERNRACLSSVGFGADD